MKLHGIFLSLQKTAPFPRLRARYSTSLACFLLTVFIAGARPAPAQPVSGMPAGSAAVALAGDNAAAEPIPLAEITTEAESVLARVRDILAEVSADRTLQLAAEQVPLLTREIDARLRETRNILAQRPSIQMLGYLEAEWRALRRNLAGWTRDLSSYLSRLDRHKAELEKLSNVWEQTLEAARASNAPPEIIGRIQTVLSELKQAREIIERQQARALILQNRIAAQESRIGDALALLGRMRENALDRLFVRDSPPVWRLDLGAAQSQGVQAEGGNSLATQWQAVTAYAARQMPSFLIHAFIFILIAAGFKQVRRRMEPRLKEEDRPACSALVLKTPVAAAFMLSLLFARWLYPYPPRLLWAVIGALALVPSIIILRRLILRDFYPALYGLSAFYIVDQLRTIAAAEQFLPRLFLLGEMLGVVVLLGWLLRSLRAVNGQAGEPQRLRRIIEMAASLALTVAAASFMANVLGYVTLANLLGNAILGSAYFALILYALIELLDGLVAIAFRLRPFRMLRIVSLHGPLLQRRIRRILQWTAVVLWFLFTLDRLLLRDSLFKGIGDILTKELVVGALTISLGEVLAFVVTLWVAFLVSRFVRFVLDEEVFPRISLRRGLPYAISTMLNYVILLIGFFAAVAALGVDMTKVTILAGAFSVGVGFGLQNIFNNFVSGIILLFERPVNVGDVVQIDDASGVVERIGIRASVIGTPNGADVIVPNGKLISDRLINWTFSNRQRSIELQIAVAHGVDPRSVIALLERTAAQHQHIRRDPPPKALLVKLGPDSLGFELRAWTDRVYQWMEVRSELAIAVSDALAAEKIPLRAG